VPDAEGRGGGIFSAEAEVVLWWLASATANNVVAASGVLGQPGTGVLANPRDAEHSAAPQAGGRFSLGYWDVEDNPWLPGGIRDLGAEGVFFFVGQHSRSISIAEQPNLELPFSDLNHSQESGFVVAQPGVSTGSIAARAQANVWGAEANVWKNLYYDCPGTTCILDVVAGFRFLEADEQFADGASINYDPTIAANSPFASFAGNRLQLQDSFTTHNHFYGGQIGLANKWWVIEKVCVETSFKLALGVTAEDLNIIGNQVRTFADGTTAVSTGGLFALPSNIGHHQLDRFTEVPEVRLRFLVPVQSHITLTAGFSTLYWSNLARAAQQVDREIDITQIPNFPGGAGATPAGLGHPAVLYRQSDLWVLGATLGVEVKW
jgi:hypothetical protein